ncbi:hypothetical protein [Hydrogenophaga sp.]|uniref:hypothetical protein n=1 Tax=Hydrogenophaga sp. TaxID=1904254 RepID=UPI00271A8CD5|nr:hypothetical protein [Hydrogenophaga sp.]MDO9436983.1 hypothetical protein [Hydrogenophaga sp.]
MHAANAGPRGGIAGMKRGDPDVTGDLPSAKKPRTETPEEVLARWKVELKESQCVLDDDEPEILSDIALGKLVGRKSLQDFFWALLLEGAWGVFVEAFKVNAKTQATAWEHKHRFDLAPPAFKSEFMLPVWPEGDGDYEGMLDALGSIGAHEICVDRVCDSFLLGETVVDKPMPEGVSRCIAALLKGGATSLQIHGPLTSPEIVVNAFSSSSLETIALGSPGESVRRLTKLQTASYAALLAGLKSCTTLKHVHINHGQLLVLGLAKALEDCGNPGGPALETVCLKMESLQASLDQHPDALRQRQEQNAAVVAIVQTISRFPTLKVFETDTTINTTVELQKSILEPLSNCGSLTALSIHSMVAFEVDAGHMQALFALFSFAAGLKTLTHLTHDVAKTVGRFDFDRAIAALRAFHVGGGDVHQLADAQALRSLLEAPDFALKHLRLCGFCLPAGLMRIFCDALSNNASLETIDMRHNLIDLESMFRLIAVLNGEPLDGVPRAPQWMLRGFKISEEHGGYYWVGDGRIDGFKAGQVAREFGAGPNFRLQFSSAVDEEARRRARASFLPRKRHADVLFQELGQRLQSNQRTAKLMAAKPEMQTNLEHFMLAAMRAGGADKERFHTTSSFDSAAQWVVHELNREQGLTGIAHLPQVLKGADAHLQHEPERAAHMSGVAFRQLAKDDLLAKLAKLAARRDALPVNTKDWIGRNERLIAAVWERNVDEVRRLRKGAATDYGDAGLKLARTTESLPLIEAFTEKIDESAIRQALEEPIATTTTTTTSVPGTTTNVTDAAPAAPVTMQQVVQLPAGAPPGFADADDPANWG